MESPRRPDAGRLVDRAHLRSTSRADVRVALSRALSRMPDSPSSPIVLPVPWEDFFSHAPLPMGVLSRNGEDARFLKANAASAAQLGVAPAEMEGRSALELGLPPALVQGWLLSLEAAHQLGKPLDVRWQLAAGHGLRTFTTRLIPFTDGGEPMQHFGYINQDWTGAQTSRSTTPRSGSGSPVRWLPP